MTARPAFAALTAGAAFLCYLLLLPLPLATRVIVLLLLVPLPALMVMQARLLLAVDVDIPRTAAYLSSIVSLWVLAALVLAVSVPARADWLGPLTTEDLLRDVGILTLVGVALLYAGRRVRGHEARILRMLLPVTQREKALFVGISVTAGVCEELVYRGFLLDALLTVSNPVTATVVSAGAFGVVHAYQGVRGAARATLIGLVFAVALLNGVSLLSLIVAHALIDILSGFWLAPRLLR